MMNPEFVSPAEAADILSRARTARERLSDIIDRFVAKNIVLDPSLLTELGRFLEEEGYAAAEAYRMLVEARVRQHKPAEASRSVERRLPGLRTR